MCRICILQLGSNFVVWLAADKNFYLRLTVKRIYAFAVFRNKYLRPFGCSNPNFSAKVKCTNAKTEIQSEIIETQIIGMQINFVIFCSQFIDLVISYGLNQIS